MESLNMKNLRNNNGFSVAELLIVVTILGILGGFAIQNVVQTMELRRLDSYVSIVSAKMDEARSQAIKHNRTTWLTIDTINRTTKIQTTSAAGGTVTLSAAEPIPGNFGMTASGLPTPLITTVDFKFDSMGRRTSAASKMSFNFEHSGASISKSVSVSPSGNIKVEAMRTIRDFNL